VRRSFRGGGVTSKRLRGQRERKVLDTYGHKILAYELKADCIFATAEQLVRRIVEDCPQSSTSSWMDAASAVPIRARSCYCAI